MSIEESCYRETSETIRNKRGNITKDVKRVCGIIKIDLLGQLMEST